MVETQLAEDRPRRRGEDAGLAGDLLREFAECGGVDDPAAGTTGGGQSDGDTVVGGDLLDGGVDEGVEFTGVGRCGGAQGGEVAAPQGGTLAGAGDDGRGDVVGPALAELPGAGDAFADVAGALAGGAGDAAQGVGDRVGEHRAEGGVALRHAGDGVLQVGDLRVGGAVDGAEPELDAEVEQELVAAGGHTVDEGLDGVGDPHLLGSDLRPQGDEQRGGVGRPVGDVVGAGAAGRGGRGGLLDRGGCRRGFRGGGAFDGRGSGGGTGVGVLLLGGCLVDDLVGGEHDAAVALDVEDLDVAVGVLREAQ